MRQPGELCMPPVHPLQLSIYQRPHAPHLFLQPGQVRGVSLPCGRVSIMEHGQQLIYLSLVYGLLRREGHLLHLLHLHLLIEHHAPLPLLGNLQVHCDKIRRKESLSSMVGSFPPVRIPIIQDHDHLTSLECQLIVFCSLKVIQSSRSLLLLLPNSHSCSSSGGSVQGSLGSTVQTIHWVQHTGRAGHCPPSTTSSCTSLTLLQGELDSLGQVIFLLLAGNNQRVGWQFLLLRLGFSSTKVHSFLLQVAVQRGNE